MEEVSSAHMHKQSSIEGPRIDAFCLLELFKWGGGATEPIKPHFILKGHFVKRCLLCSFLRLNIMLPFCLTVAVQQGGEDLSLKELILGPAGCLGFMGPGVQQELESRAFPVSSLKEHNRSQA